MKQDLSQFPLILCDTSIRAALAEKPEIRFMEQTNGTTVCCYLIATETTFDNNYAREARGLVFDKRGVLISRPLHKFHNVGERQSTYVENLDWSKVCRVMDKRDGSMIHTVAAVDGVLAVHPLSNFAFKSKKSFTSDVVVQATAFVVQAASFLVQAASDPLEEAWYLAFCDYCVENNLTAIFEWTSPVARIVLAYPKAELRLLHIRDNASGQYLLLENLQELCIKYNIPLVDHCWDIMAMFTESTNKLKTLTSLVEDTEGVEGWVFQFDSGDMVKVKTKWYLERHRAMTFLRVRDIARLAIDEQLDDLKSLLVAEKVDITQILAIEESVKNEVNYIMECVDLAFAPNSELSRKDFAILMKGHPHFQLLMQRYIGKEVDVKSWFTKNVLDQKYGLTQINLLQSLSSTTEVE